MPGLIAFPVLLFGRAVWWLSLAVPAPAGANPAGSRAVPALYATQAEAEAAAARFGCKAAHRIGKQWMPSAQHCSGGSGTQPASGH
jgi:hypothetical protein